MLGQDYDLFLGGTLIAALGLLLESRGTTSPAASRAAVASGPTAAASPDVHAANHENGRIALVEPSRRPVATVSVACRARTTRTPNKPPAPVEAQTGTSAAVAASPGTRVDSSGPKPSAAVTASESGADPAATLATVYLRRRLLLGLSVGALGLAVATKPTALPFSPCS